jgi:chromosome segregation ATPase
VLILNEEFKRLKLWVEKCPVEAAMRIEELEQKFKECSDTLNEARRKRDEVKNKLEVTLKTVKQQKYLIRELEGSIGWHVETNERYENAMKRIQKNYEVEDVDYIPITGLYEIQLIIKNALDGK